MNKSVLLIITALMTFTAQIHASNDYKITYDRLNSGTSQIHFELKGFKVEKIEKDGRFYSKILFEAKSLTNRKGFAELPFVSSSVQISNEKNVSYEFITGEVEEIKLADPVLPSRGALSRSTDISLIPYEISDNSLFDGSYPEKTAEGTEPFIFRDTRGVNLIFYPFRYNSVKQTLEVVKKITVRITENNDEPVNAMKRSPRQIAKEMDGVYRSLYINYNESKSLQIGDLGEILVILTENNGGLAAIQPYIDWKKQLGYTVSAIELPNGTDLNISQTVTSAYESNPNILFVQLIGDWENLKSDFQYYSVTATDGGKDPVLGHVTGRDRYQDVIIGRFSAQNETELADQIAKSISYEKFPDADGGWYTRSLGIASNEGEGYGDDAESDQLHNEIIINNKLLPSTYDGSYEVYQAEGGNAAQISAAINGGVSLINYTGHGYYQEFSTPRFTSANVKALTNGNKLPVVISVACLTGHLSYPTDCFAETWLKKADGGAVAGWFSTISQPWLPPMRGQDYFNDILIGGYDYENNPGDGFSTTEQRKTFGAITVNAAVLTLAEDPNDVSTYATIETWTLFGDAALMIRRDKPQQVEIMNETLLVENYSTKITSGGEPLEGALVTVFQNGSVVSAVSDSNGDVLIAHPFVEGDAVVTVSGFNLATKQITVPVITPVGAYLKVTDYSFTGSGYGQTSEALIRIKNIGTEATQGMSVSVKSSSDYAAVRNGDREFKEMILSPDSVFQFAAAAEIDISPLTPDQHKLELEAVLKDGLQRQFVTRLFLTVNSPSLNATHSFDNESAMQGGQQTVTFRVKNSGHAALYNGIFELEQLSAHDIVISGTALADSLLPGEETEASFVCSYGSGIPNSAYADFRLKISTADGFYSFFDYSIVVGMTEDFETGDFSVNQWGFSGEKNWVVEDTLSFAGEYCASSGEVNDAQTATMSVNFNFESDGFISFYRKVSSEVNYDRLAFYIDGVLKKLWSGSLDWEKFLFEVAPGAHEFKWTFSRDKSIGWGLNRAWVDNILVAGAGATGIEEIENDVLAETAVLFQNYPNPFNPVTKIGFFLAKPSEVRLKIYNVHGQIVAEPVKGFVSEGIHSVEFDASKLNSGIYYYTLNSENVSESRKMILLK